MLSNHNTFNYVQYHDVARNARNLLLRRIPTLRSIDRSLGSFAYDSSERKLDF